MRKSYIYQALSFFVSLALISIICSCSSIQNVKYLQDIPDSAKIVTKLTADYSDPVIGVGDILSITIQTIDPSTSAVANQVTTPDPSGALNVPAVSGYLVDKNGEVDFPLIGKIKVLGYTTYQAREIVLKRAALFYKEPSVQLRFANFKVTVMGEVNRPNTYIFPNEKVSIFDALGLAGDLTIYGKRDNIMLIREEDGKKVISRLNLTTSNVFKNDYYYLKQNDVIYVEPDKSKSAVLNAPQRNTITLILTGLTAIALIISRFR